MVMGKEVDVQPKVVTLSYRAMAIEVVVFVFGSVGSLVGTLSGHYPVLQLAFQFVFRSMRVPGWYLDWALPGPLRYICDPCVVNIFCVSHVFIFS